MSVSRKVLRRMKKVMGLIGAIPVLTACSFQISCAANFYVTEPTYRQEMVLCKVEVKNGDTMIVSADQNAVGVIPKDFPSCLVVVSPVRSSLINDREPDKSLSQSQSQSIKDLVRLKSITKLVIKGSITKIEANAFREFKSLEVVEILSNMKYIGESAFDGLRKLRSVKIDKIDNGYEKKTIEKNIERLLKDKERLQKEKEEDEEQSFSERTRVNFDNGDEYITAPYYSPYFVNKIRECEESIKNNKEMLEILNTLLYVSDCAFSDCCNLKCFEVNGAVSFSKSAFCGCDEKLQSFNGGAFNELKYHFGNFCRCSDHYYDEVYYRNYVLPHNLLLESRKK